MIPTSRDFNDRTPTRRSLVENPPSAMSIPQSLPLLALAALLLAGCGRELASPSAAQASLPPLAIATYYWPGEFWIDIAHDQGWFAAAGLHVRVVDTNPDYFASFKDTVEGRIDVNTMTLFDVMLHNARGADLVCIANSDISAGADGIVARPGLATLADLRGRRIGVSRGTYQEYMLNVVLAREGIDLAAVTLVDLPSEKSPEQLLAGNVDAAFTWEPLLGEAVTRTKGIKLWDTAVIPGISPVVLATRRSLVRERPDDLQKMMQVWLRTTRFITERPDEAFAIVARVNRKTPAEVREFARVDRIIGLRENLGAFAYSSGFDSLHGAAKVINDFLGRQNLATTPLDSSGLLDPRFLKALK